MAFSDVLKSLRKRYRLTQKELATAIGISESAIGMYEQGRREPDFETLESFADYFNVDMDFLTGRSNVERKFSYSSEEVLSDDEQHLIEIYRSLTPAHKETILSTASDFAALDAQKNKDLSLVEKAN